MECFRVNRLKIIYYGKSREYWKVFLLDNVGFVKIKVYSIYVSVFW